MMKYNDISVMKGIAICFKPYLQPEEAMIYCNLSRTQLTKKCDEYGIFEISNGYYKREERDLIISGAKSKYSGFVKKIRL